MEAHCAIMSNPPSALCWLTGVMVISCPHSWFLASPPRWVIKIPKTHLPSPPDASNPD